MLAIDPKALIVSSSDANKYPVDATSPRNVVLVAGYDYERTGAPLRQGRSQFNVVCEARINGYVKKNPSIEENANWRFTSFDVRSGKVRRNEFDAAKQKRVWTEIQNFTPVTTANYSDPSSKYPPFDTNPEGVMSITDVYQYVSDLGTTQPGSLVELSFFSHALWNGPILVNSYDNSGSATIRDPNDKDGRFSKDFIYPRTDSVALSDFRNSFHADGFVWVWGCDFSITYHEVLDKVVRNAKYKSAQGPADEDQFSFSFDQEWADLYFGSDPGFFPKRDTSNQFPLTFTRTFVEVKKYFQRGIKTTYSSMIAKASGRKCYGALPGTYATFESGVGVKLALMLIPKGSPYGVNFTSYLGFYKTYLDIKLDPEGRGYGEHTP